MVRMTGTGHALNQAPFFKCLHFYRRRVTQRYDLFAALVVFACLHY